MSDTTVWEPHAVTTTEVVEHGPVAALGALLDDGLPVPGVGDPLPALWHWVALPRWSPSSTLDRDGHPVRGTFLPPVDLPRRMFAGGEVAVHRPLVVGEEVRREARVASVEEKTGRSGRLVVVVVETSFRGPDGDLRVEERQDIVFREASPVTAAAEEAPAAEPAATMTPVGPPLARADAGRWDLATDPSLLMRFSAATANAHRIHYDWPYATRVEGYPGLVVHGPLMTLLLAETLREAESLPARVRLRHRNQAPLFCGTPATILHAVDGDGVTATLERGHPDHPVVCTSLTAHPLEKGTIHA
ncbi:HTD2 family dehydratase [Nocardioides pakistanensis]